MRINNEGIQNYNSNLICVYFISARNLSSSKTMWCQPLFLDTIVSFPLQQVKQAPFKKKKTTIKKVILLLKAQFAVRGTRHELNME